jgi:hypothetical protein
MVGIYLDPPVRSPVFIVVAVFYLGKAVAAAKLAEVIPRAFTATSKTILGGCYAFSKSGVVNEAEVWGQYCVVFFVDDCDRKFLMCVKASNLAPVAGVFFFLQVLELGQLKFTFCK